MPTIASHVPKVVSVFSGIGGLDLGLEMAGFTTIACIERDKLARKTLIANRPSWYLTDPGDIELISDKLRPQSFGLVSEELDLLAGANPCQPFSKAAQWSNSGKNGLADSRSDCIHSFLSLFESFLPKVLLIENVPGFVSGRTSAVPVLLETLNTVKRKKRVNYKLFVQTLNCIDYGVPQRRERAIVIAIRDEVTFNWPIETHASNPLRAWDAIGGMNECQAPLPTGFWADLLPSIPEGMNYIWHTEKGGGRSLFSYRSRYWTFLLKLAKTQPSWTISAQPGPSTGPFHWNNRPLSVRELLRLQTFPATWIVRGNYRQQLKQIGNATPPLLAEVLGRAIGQEIFGLTYENKPKLLISRKRGVPPASETKPVPKKYRFLERKYEAHPGTGKGPRPVSRIEVANG